MKRFYTTLLLSLFSVNAYALVFDKCHYSEGPQFDLAKFEKYQYEFFPTEGKVRQVFIYTDNELKKLQLGSPSNSFEKIFISIFDVIFIDESYIKAVNIEEGEFYKTSQNLILDLKNGKANRSTKSINKYDNSVFINQSWKENCKIVSSSLKSSSGNSNGTFKNILGKYLGK